MSLIYDYLKVDGKSEPTEGSPAAEIHPTLKRSIPERPNLKTMPLVLGICVSAVILLFLVFKMFSTEEHVPEPEMVASSPQVQTLQSMPADSPIVSESVSVSGQSEADPAKPDIAQSLPQPAAVKSDKKILVFPETETPIVIPVEDMSGIFQENSAITRKKIPQQLELNRVSKKTVVTAPAPLDTDEKIYDVKEPEILELPKEIQVKQVMDARDIQQATKASVSRRTPEPVPVAPARFYNKPETGSISQARSNKLYQAGLHAQLTGDQRDAELFYKKTLEAANYHPEALINLSALYVQQQRYIDAEEILSLILNNDPGNSKALVNMGVLNLDRRDIVLAEEYFKAALDANPLEENALINLAYLAEKSGDYESTERYYRLLLQIAPDNIEVLLAYGYLLEEVERVQEAIALYDDCLKLDIVKKNQQLYDRITRRMRLLSRAAGK